MNRSTTVACGVLLALLTATCLASPAQADEVPSDQRVFVTGSSEGAAEGHSAAAYSLDLTSAPAGTTISGFISSCGRVLEAAYFGRTLTVGADGLANAFFVLPTDNESLPTQYPSDQDRQVDGISLRLIVSDLVGPTWEYSLTVTQPGFDPYVLSGTRDVTLFHRPSCARIDTTFDHTIRVTRWSHLKGQPRVGRTVTAKRPLTSGPAKISYRWHLDRKTVIGRHHSLKLTRDQRHKSVYVVVRISQPGRTTQTESLAFPHGVR